VFRRIEKLEGRNPFTEEMKKDITKAKIRLRGAMLRIYSNQEEAKKTRLMFCNCKLENSRGAIDY
jgi:hypothetical protein